LQIPGKENGFHTLILLLFMEVFDIFRETETILAPVVQAGKEAFKVRLNQI